MKYYIIYTLGQEPFQSSDQKTVQDCTIYKHFLEDMNSMCSILTAKRTIQTYDQVQKPVSVLAWASVSALGKGNLHFCDDCINAER